MGHWRSRCCHVLSCATAHNIGQPNEHCQDGAAQIQTVLVLSGMQVNVAQLKLVEHSANGYLHPVNFCINGRASAIHGLTLTLEDQNPGMRITQQSGLVISWLVMPAPADSTQDVALAARPAETCGLTSSSIHGLPVPQHRMDPQPHTRSLNVITCASITMAALTSPLFSHATGAHVSTHWTCWMCKMLDQLLLQAGAHSGPGMPSGLQGLVADAGLHAFLPLHPMHSST